jgi:ribosomal protein L44E
MPICVNPKCGQISKSMSPYCPSCGQQTLSRIDRSQVDGPHSTDISMENFDRVTSDVPAPRERMIGKSRKRSKRKKIQKKWSTPKFRSAPRPSGKKIFWVVTLVAIIGIYVLGQTNPSLVPEQIRSGLGDIKRSVVQVLPHSKAYQLGFDEGNRIRNLEDGLQVLDEHFESYGVDVRPDASVDEQIRYCEETVTIDPEQCAEMIREQNSPEYQRKIYKQWAETSWLGFGSMNFLKNTPQNKRDFVSGFMTGMFG